ncbi:MAG: Alginate lyase [Rariglobus sp.]|jgi:hypothetical protein|nr:Alginate lyase [Rariglobus sp.]
MNTRHLSLCCLLAGLSWSGAASAAADPSVARPILPAPQPAESRLLLTDVQAWQAYRTGVHANPDALKKLRQAASANLSLKRFSVVDKSAAPPGGTLHDYTSLGPYWWPDPAKPDGLPYIRRDGERNPESLKTDRAAMESLGLAVSSLIHHAWVDDSAGRRDSEAHARQAARLLRAWFLEPETRMNPHLRFAQRIPGVSEGRGIGIIDTAMLCFLLDEVSLFEHMADTSAWGDGVWTAGDREGLRQWFSDYLDWLLTSDHGRDECKEHNNHGTWYDAQVATFAVFCGRPEVARRQIDELARGRIAKQIAPDGSQPHELARTLSLTYSTFNLLGFAVLARVDARVPQSPADDGSEKAPGALWRWRGENGAGIIPALDWLLPYQLGERPWPHRQITPFSIHASAAWFYRLAGQETGNALYADAARKLAREPWSAVSYFGAGMKSK